MQAISLDFLGVPGSEVASKTANLIEEHGFPSDKRLGAGVVDGRSVWSDGNTPSTFVSALQAKACSYPQDFPILTQISPPSFSKSTNMLFFLQMSSAPWLNETEIIQYYYYHRIQFLSGTLNTSADMRKGFKEIRSNLVPPADYVKMVFKCSIWRWYEKDCKIGIWIGSFVQGIKNISVQSSTTLQHLPYCVDLETDLPKEVEGRLSFACQKLKEIVKAKNASSQGGSLTNALSQPGKIWKPFDLRSHFWSTLTASQPLWPKIIIIRKDFVLLTNPTVPIKLAVKNNDEVF